MRASAGPRSLGAGRRPPLRTLSAADAAPMAQPPAHEADGPRAPYLAWPRTQPASERASSAGGAVPTRRGRQPRAPQGLREHEEQPG
eukprot:5223520-Pyramimonas_sp.AAC.1